MYVIQYKSLNKPFQDIFNHTYRMVNYDDIYVICEPDTLSIFGYLSIIKKHVTSSKLFDQLQSITSAYYDIDLKNPFANFDCYCINDMQIKQDLSKVDIEQIFNIVALIYANKDTEVLIWKEHQGKLLFYPIDLRTNNSSFIGFPSFAAYFANNIYDSQISH